MTDDHRPIPKIKTSPAPTREIPRIKTEPVTDEPKTFEIKPIRSYTLQEARAEQKEAIEEHRRRDIVERLKSHRAALDGKERSNIYDAITEIEWLRAERPDAVTRGELVEMAARLREMQTVIASMLERIEK